MSSASATDRFTFGVEIETLVRPKGDPAFLNMLAKNGYVQSKSDTPGRGRRENHAAIREALVDVLEEAQIRAIAAHDAEADTNYNAWTIAWDTSISENTSEGAWSGFYGVEFISSILYADEDWPGVLHRFWKAINKYVDIRTHPSCGTHVHMRPYLGFNLDQLKNAAKAVIQFEPFVRDAVPPERKDCQWAQSNIDRLRENPALTQLFQQCRSTKSYGPLYKQIDRCESLDVLSGFMSPEKLVSWNFRNTLKPCGTLEFRRAPQVRSAESTQHWIAFALSFLVYSLLCDFSSMRSAPNLSEFQNSIHRSADWLGIRSALGVWKTMGQTVQTRGLTEQEIAAVKFHKEKKRSRFVEKASNQASPQSLPRTLPSSTNHPIGVPGPVGTSSSLFSGGVYSSDRGGSVAQSTGSDIKGIGKSSQASSGWEWDAQRQMWWIWDGERYIFQSKGGDYYVLNANGGYERASLG